MWLSAAVRDTGVDYMDGFHWIGLIAAGTGLLLVTALVGLVRICFEVEQLAPEEPAPGQGYDSPRSLGHRGAS
jgi:hypothetical protein